MKVENVDMGPMMMRTLSYDTAEAIEKALVEYIKDGWHGSINHMPGGITYATLFKWRENKKPLSNHLKII